MNLVLTHALEITLWLPFLGIFILGFLGGSRGGALLNIALSSFTFVGSVALAWGIYLHAIPNLSPQKWFYIDEFNVYLIVLTAFVGLNTAIFSRSYMSYEIAKGKLSPNQMRLYHAMYQGFMFAMLLALTTNNLGLLWVAMEAATLATVLLVSLYRTPESIEAAWKYFILCGVGIAQALFGTVLLYFAAEQVIPEHQEALLWNILATHSSELQPVVLSIAFVFLLVGYGTKVGLVPLHNWLPDAHSEGPTPMSAVLSGLLLNVALYALVRMKVLVDGSLQNHLAGHLMMGFGLLTFLVAALFLHRQRDIKRMYSYSSIEHMGLMTFAFGVSTAMSTFAALLHMAVHSLTKSAIFITVGHATHITESQQIDKMRGLILTQPSVGWGLLLGTAAIAGFPPFGVFMSEFLLISATMKQYPWLVIPLLLGLSIAFAGLFKHVQPIVFGEAPKGQMPVLANMLPVLLQLGIVLCLGLFLPNFLTDWFQRAADFLSHSTLWNELV